MNEFVLYDDRSARTFEPFALTRPAGELRAGAELVRRRWEVTLGSQCVGFIGSGHLADFSEFDSPPAVVADELSVGSIVVNARCAPALVAMRGADLWSCGGRVAAVRLHRPLSTRTLADGTFQLDSLMMPTARLAHTRGWWIDHVWDIIRHLPDMLADDVPRLVSTLVRASASGATVLGTHDVAVEEGAQIEPQVVFDATTGPILVRRGATVRAFTRLVGPCVIGRDTQVLGGKITGSSVGDVCRVHGEVSTTVFIGHANKGHDGFVGHSLLGRWVNLGAGTVTSNLKNTYGPVQFWTPTGDQDTGMQFLGSMFGDHAKTAIGTRLVTGSLIGAGANLFCDGMAPKVLSPFAWGTGDGVYDIGKFLDVVERAMARRQVSLGDGQRRSLRRAYAARWRAGRETRAEESGGGGA